jgi:hypothetical protein
MFLLARGFVDFKRQGPRSKFPERWLLFRLVGEVEMLFLNFLRQFDAGDRHGRRFESLEPEHRQDRIRIAARRPCAGPYGGPTRRIVFQD